MHEQIKYKIPAAIAMAAALAAVSGLVAQQAPGAHLEILPVRPNFYMIAGAGGNIGFQVGADGVVVVDAGSASNADAVVEAIKKVTPQPIRYVINTSADADHVGGNETLAKAGKTLFTQGGIGVNADFLGGAASILSVEQVLTRMSAPASKYPIDAWPTEPSISRGSTCSSMARASKSSISRGTHRRRRHRFLPPLRRRDGR